MDQAKPFCISKWCFVEAFKQVKASKGGAGGDGQTIEEFEGGLKDNLYKLWNRMSSGSYFPPPVLRAEIPKGDGRMRPLGIPTVADRVAQQIVKQELEPVLERHFHSDSYGYRPGKSALDAVERARRNCWKYNWVLDLDIKGFFDNIDHDLLMKAVRWHTEEKWVLLYIERWLKTPILMTDGTVFYPDKGTPQGGVISPLLANLFLHYAFDKWMEREYPATPFERYADDVLCHCVSRGQAERLLEDLSGRMLEVGLELHLDKTRIVYCKDSNRKEEFGTTSFDFLGFTFRPRLSRNRSGVYFVNFSPAISNKAKKSIFRTIRSWRLSMCTLLSIDEIAARINSRVRGWLNYYGRFCRSAMYPIFRHLNRRLSRWAMRKYKRFRYHELRASRWLGRIANREPGLFVHWFAGIKPSAGQ